MKNLSKLICTFLLLLLLMAPASQVSARDWSGSQVIFGNNFTLASGETLSGDLVVFGGSVLIEEDSTVTGNLVLFGGSLNVAGQVIGDLVLIGGTGKLYSTAIINGNLITTGGSIQKEAGAVVEGETNQFSSVPGITINVPSQVGQPALPEINADVSRALFGGLDLSIFTELFWLFVTSLGWAALAALAMLFFDVQTQRVSTAVLHQPIIGGSMGLLTILAGTVIIVVLSVTILLIPVALVGILILVFACVFGWIAIGVELGQRISHSIHQEWSLPLTAALGTFTLNFVANGIGKIPCIGWVVPMVIGLIGLGAVVLSRFGTQVYPQVVPMVVKPVEKETQE